VESQRERELKFDVAKGFQVPQLAELVTGPVHTKRRTVRITSTYYDTGERALLASGLTLRRREGDVDAGWQLKVPAGSARTEIRLPPEAGVQVPEQLRRLLTGTLRDRPLQPVAVIRTERHQHQLVGDRGLALEIADDHVQATALGERATIRAWREVEAELGSAGDERLLQRAATQLAAAGAVPAAATSKLARALDLTTEPAPSDARSLVRDYAQRQRIAMTAGDIALRRGLNPVHKTRVAVRRFRSMLRLLRPALDRERNAALDAELAWYQQLLGAVRDQEVQRARLAGRLAALAPEEVLGPVAAYIEQALLAEQLERGAELGQALDSPRYLALMQTVSEWADDPPLGAEFDELALQRLVRTAARKARTRLAVALRHDDPTLLHRARKAAKRARYAAELTRPITGKRGKRQVKRYKRIQDVLGEHQDSIVAAELLRRLGARSASTGQNAFTLGLLYGLEQTAARDARVQASRLDA
jgi:CHAD domain-containing protein